MDSKQIYELVHSPTPADLSDAVDDRIGDGWWPVGRPFVHGEQFIQAMVLDRSSDDPLQDVESDA